MTKDDVLKYIRANSGPGDWRVMKFAGHMMVRSVTDDPEKYECPICWVGTKLGKNPNGLFSIYEPVAKAVGLARPDAADIANAADHIGHPLRHSLLKACHLIPDHEHDLGGEG